MKVTRAVAVVAGAALAASLWTGAVSAQTESASAEDGKPASEAPAETAPAPNVPLGANLTPPLGALPLGPADHLRSGIGSAGIVECLDGAWHAYRRASRVRAPTRSAPRRPNPRQRRWRKRLLNLSPTRRRPRAASLWRPTPRWPPRKTLDADNYLDAAELEIGLDPSDPDSDDDGVADGDEVNIYFTDPFNGDSDGDGASDGEELFSTMTDPLVWDDFAAASGDVAAEVDGRNRADRGVDQVKLPLL